MVKFCQAILPLNPSVGREKSVKREVALLTREFDGELTCIKKTMHKICARSFVSFYIGRICIATMMLKETDGGEFEIANAVVDKRARRKRLGQYLAQVALNMAFSNGHKVVYLGAELEESYDERGRIVQQTEAESGAYRFWKRMKFKRIKQKEYNKVMGAKRGEEYVGVVPMKMTHRMKAAKELRKMPEIVEEVFPILREISRNLDGKERVPLIRMVTPMLGDVKITEEMGKTEFIFH